MLEDQKKKIKGKSVSLHEFLGEENFGMASSKPISWADEMENQPITDDLDFGLTKSVINKGRVALPTAPRSARGTDIDLSRVPCIPPFTAFLGNLPYDITAEEIERFFRGMKCANVRLPHDQGRLKGFGYAEFETKQSLIEALSLNHSTLHNRQIRIDLAAEPNQDRSDGDRSHRGGERDDRTPGDWRRKQDYNSDFSRGPRNNSGSMHTRYGSVPDWEFGDWGKRREGGGGRGGEEVHGDGGGRDGQWETDQFRESVGRGRPGSKMGGGRSNDLDGSSLAGWNDRPNTRTPRRLEERRSESHIGYSDITSPVADSSIGRREPSINTFSRSISSDETERHSADRYASDDRSAIAGPKERRRLVLTPRTTKQSEPDKDGPISRPSIFGGARPVDTAVREREIEERLIKQKQELEKENLHEVLLDEDARKRRSGSDGLNRSLSNTSGSGEFNGGGGRTRKESGSSQDGGTGSGSYARKERKSSSSSGKGVRTVMPPPPSLMMSRTRKDSSRSDHDDVFSEECSSPRTPLPLPIREEASKNVAAAAPCSSTPPSENVWDSRRKRGDDRII